MTEHTETVEESPETGTPASSDAEPIIPPNGDNQKSDKIAAKKNKLSKTLPTDRITFPKQFEIIVGYSSAYDKLGHQPVANTDVASIVGLASATVAMMNAFLVDVKIIQKTDGGKYIPSEEARECARMYQINPGRAWPKLAPLFEKSWFGEELIAKLRVRTLSETGAVEDLAEVAHADKDHLPQLKLALDYMERSGLISKEGGTLKLVSQSQREDAEKKGATDKKSDAINEDLRDEGDEGLERHSLTLNPQEKRRIVILTPPTITKKELERIQSWLSFQLIVSDE